MFENWIISFLVVFSHLRKVLQFPRLHQSPALYGSRAHQKGEKPLSEFELAKSTANFPRRQGYTPAKLSTFLFHNHVLILML